MPDKKKGDYGLADRITLFLAVAAIGSAIAFGFYFRYALGAAMGAGAGDGGFRFWLIIFLWLSGLIISGVLIFWRQR